MSLDGLPPLREVIAEHGLGARKSLGQNFILDLNLTGRIARSAGPLNELHVVEIGPGPGGLTRALLAEGAKHVTVIERDDRCLPALQQIAAHYPGRVDIIMADATHFNPSTLAPGHKVIVANLPYSVATPLLIGWVCAEPWPPWYDSMVLMFQREVAERIVAAPGSKAYGRLSVLAQWRTKARMLFHLPPSAFVPAPKVMSTLVRFEPKPVPAPACSRAALEKITAAAFGQRRKMLRSSLKQAASDPELMLREAGINPEARAEELSVEDFGRLALLLDKP